MLRRHRSWLWGSDKTCRPSTRSDTLNARLERDLLPDHFSHTLKQYHQLFIGTINNADEISFTSALQATDSAAKRKGIPNFDDMGTLFYEKAATADDPEALALVWQLYYETLGASVVLASEAADVQRYKAAWQETEDKVQDLKFELNCRMGEISKLKQKARKNENSSCDNVKLMFNDQPKSLHITVNKDHISLSEAQEGKPGGEALRIERSPIANGFSSDTPATTPDSVMDTQQNLTLSSLISIPFLSSSGTAGKFSSIHSVPSPSPSGRYLSYKSFTTLVHRLTRKRVRIHSEVDVVQPVWYPRSGGSVLTNGSVRTRYETGSIARFKVRLNPSTCDTVGQPTKEYRDWAVAKAEQKYGELFVPG